MIGLLAPLFLRLGVSQRVSKALAILTVILGVAALLGALWLWIDAREKADDQRNQEIGATVQREGALTKTVERVEKANEAAAKVERDPVARRDGCLRHSRTPENC
jgi:membrane protein implicated in regulation of membrane protease activity